VKVITIGVDQFGFIYMHGVSNSEAFRATKSAIDTPSWVHGKTHWELAAEL